VSPSTQCERSTPFTISAALTVNLISITCAVRNRDRLLAAGGSRRRHSRRRCRPVPRAHTNKRCNRGTVGLAVPRPFSRRCEAAPAEPDSSSDKAIPERLRARQRAAWKAVMDDGQRSIPEVRCSRCRHCATMAGSCRLSSRFRDSRTATIGDFSLGHGCVKHRRAPDRRAGRGGRRFGAPVVRPR
jgi:hypothetical protein